MTVAPRVLTEVGGVVSQGGLWHIARDYETTYCGEDAPPHWPRVGRAVERAGFWCRACLEAVVEASDERGLQEDDSREQDGTG